MAPNDFYPSGNNYYNAQTNPSQQYPGYQTQNTAGQSTNRTYQPQNPATSQPDYISYSAQAYNGQGTYGQQQQDGSWSNNRAAEALRNLSNTAYTAGSNTTVSSAGFTPANTATSNRYSATVSQPPQNQYESRLSSTQAHASYGQTQARPRSVNATANARAPPAASQGLPSPAVAAGYPSQRVQATFNQQRSASPAHPAFQANHSSAHSTSKKQSSSASATQYTDFSNRVLPHVTEPTRNALPAVASASYNYGDRHATAPVIQTTAGHFEQPTITVDPMQVYDPWPEYQRKQEALRAQKAAEDAVLAEQKRKEDEVRRIEEARKKAEEEQKKAEEERIKAEEERRLEEQRPPRKSAVSASVNTVSTDAPQTSSSGQDTEAEIRALMVKMRELNSKDPALLAKIWEQERKSHVASQQAQTQTPAAPSPTLPGAPAVQTPTQPHQIQQTHTPVQTPKPVRQQKGGTIWPPDKTQLLAETASKWLNDILENKDRPITPAQILRMLDSNPSYVDLCEQLEKLGLKLDRALFAKSLLAAVPDVNSASRQSAQAAQPAPSGPKSQVANGLSVQTATGHMENAPPPVSHYPPPDSTPSNTPYYNNYPPFPRADSPPYMPQDDSPPPLPAPVAQMVPKKESPRVTPRPAPASKEEAARKRDFSEFVDLTALSDEDDLPPVKKSKAEQNFPRQSLAGSAPPSARDTHAPSPNFGPFPMVPSQPLQGTTTPPTKDPRFTNIVQPINKKKALRRSAYDIKTIARDVLLATGRHPHMRALNAHLEVLKSSFAEVDNTSDLSTLRWDIIDPGEPPIGYLQNSLFTQEQEDADDEDDSDDEQSRAQARPQVAVQQMVGVGGGGGMSSFSATPSFSSLMKEAPKKRGRGRPPRASYPVTSRPSGFGDSESSPRTKPPPTNRAAGGTGYAALREHNEDGTPVKKRGRPVGWRKAIHGSAEAQGREVTRGPSGLRNVSTAGADSTTTKASKGPKSANKMKTQPNYQVFKCKWQLCTAELHNLETLRKHVEKIHGKAAAHGGFDCLWENCGKDITFYNKRTGDSEQQHQYFDFDNISKWREHLELQHFSPLAWTMGDGPPSGLSDAGHNSDANMSDHRARRVTPRITAPSSLHDNPRDDRATSSAAPEPARRGRPPKPSQEQVAQETEQAMLKKKRDIGPGVDRGGARLVTPKRRRGFDDAEDFDELIVDKEDE
ncbi:hypothetical protein BU16DRAFT_459943 [Lophium mytilinum]|uniref:C2H2-type domain-containing protein n=1 Tax=Lophium mytilinum TaxID=390894 RepID=A0A6A6QVW4_9PEZI|nr:hypothetical protein BU16DRAFT_459943 [Lophium mytilinum]